MIAYPTLEGLFGEMDFCDCEHCRSFLSPAAYLVDLLLFLEPDSAAWAQELADWQAAHGNAPYPFQTLQAWQAAGQPAPLKPLQVLLERRPDIQHLPLTCENTNKPLPAIDLVNETLEYFIVNRERPFSLEDYQGHSTTADIPAQELLASPQHVQDEAYDLLAETFFPPPLPFHQPLENLRLCFDRFGVPLPAVMEALSPHDALDRPDRPGSYGWRDILMEEIQLSRAEHKLLTNYDLDPPRNQALTLNRLYGYDLSLPEAAVVADLSNVKTFARRVGITYEEVYAVLRTRFVNPGSTLLPRLEALGVPFSTLKALRDGAIAEIDFGNLLPRGLNPAAYGGDPAALTGGSRNYVAVMGAAVKAWVASAYDDIMGLITAANPGDEEDLCSFESLELRYADPDKIAAPVRAFEFIRLIRFIRLWKKLGWTIEQTDKAITALYPVSQTPNHPSDDAVNRQRLDAGFLALLPRLGVIRRLMTTLKLKPKKDLLPLLACFAPIDTHGAASLYRQMFLAKPLPRQDPAFADDGFGRFLTGDERLLDHAGELRAAFQLTSVEFDEIAAALGFDEDTPLGRRLTLEEMAARLGRTPTATEQALLTDTYRVENISALFRWGWLARKLKLSVRELRALSQVTGNDPFAAPDPPAPAILGFIDFLQRLRAASLKPVEALYLIWNQDISGRSAPAAGEILELARTLRRELAAIEREYALVDDPDGQIARTRLAQVFGNAAADHFFGLLEGAVLSDVPYSHDTEDGALEQPILDAAGGRLSYDSMRKRLAFAGAMPDASRAALLAVPGVTAAFAAAVTELHSKSWAFFDRYPQLRPHYDAYAASSDPAETKRFNLLAALLPELKRLRKRQQAIQVVAATAQADATLAGALLDDARVLQAAGNDSQPAMDDLTALEQAGLTAQFFFAGVIGREPDEQRDGQAPIDYGAAGGNNLPANSVSPGDPIACVWSGYLEAPENGFYNLTVQADAGATVHLALDGQDVELALLDGSPTWSNQAAIELTAGKLYPITLAVEQVRATLILRWESTGRGREVIPPPQLYSSTLAERLAAVYVRLLKTAALAAALRLSVGEVVHFATQPTYQIDDRGWLNSLPVEGSPDVATGAGLLAAFDALIAFARLKAEFSPSDERLLAVLIDPLGAARVTRENMDSLLFSLTRWEPRSLDGLLEHLRLAVADLARVETLHRVWQAYGPLKKLRVPVAVLLGSATNAPSAAAVRELHAALRARYDQDDWLNVLQPINDRLRGRQRDALVAFILHHLRANAQTRHIDTADKLFEYFLMDVQMEPCMQTSRIRHALSAVQLFVERCFMNLEPRVAPSALAANHWAWMKRYRVWEANRKIFLWPENWLEPELRGDQSPFFKEAVSELLQSDITEERAAMALLNYLAKLDEVAKLEPCGIFYAEGDSASERDVTHVVARTAGANRKYFYRRRSDNDGPWTPWEQIKLDIEGNPVLPVVWKGRLFLFWVRILMQAPLDPPDHLPETGTLTDNPPADLLPKTAPKVTVQAILCWSEYYNNKWQTPRTSAISSPATVIKVPADRFSRSRLSLSVFDTGLDMLQVSVGYGGLMDNYLRSSFRLYNTHSNPSSTQYGPETPIDHHHTESLSRHIYGTLLAFDPAKASDLTISYNSGPGTTPFKHVVLGKTDLGEAITQPFHKLMVSWLAPFFYEDKRHVFYVTTQISHKAALSVETYHPQGAPQPLAMDIPPLEWTVKPKPWDPPVDGFLFEDAIVNKVIATTGEVRYGGLPISPAGGLHPTDTIEEV